MVLATQGAQHYCLSRRPVSAGGVVALMAIIRLKMGGHYLQGETWEVCVACLKALNKGETDNVLRVRLVRQQESPDASSFSYAKEYLALYYHLACAIKEGLVEEV